METVQKVLPESNKCMQQQRIQIDAFQYIQCIDIDDIVHRIKFIFDKWKSMLWIVYVNVAPYTLIAYGMQWITVACE